MNDKLKETTIQIGPGFFSTLAIVFIVCKLIGYINWPWIWVVAPLWVPPAVLLGVALVLMIGAIVVVGAIALAERWSEK